MYIIYIAILIKTAMYIYYKNKCNIKKTLPRML